MLFIGTQFSILYTSMYSPAEATKEFLAIEFKRTQDARNNYVERATAVAQEQYKSLLAGLQAVSQKTTSVVGSTPEFGPKKTFG